MNDTIIVAVIGAAASVGAALIAAKVASSKIMQEMQTEIRVMQTKMDSMCRDLAEHNHYAKLFSESLPVVQEKISVANRRIADLEAGQKRLEGFHLVKGGISC